MKIRTKIRLVILMSAALGVALALIFTVAAREAHRVGNREQELGDIADGVFLLSLLSQDVTLHPDEPRAREQWLLLYGQLGVRLAATRIADRGGLAVIQRLQENHRNMRRLFEQLQSTVVRRRLPGMSEIEAEQRERLAYRMSFTAQSMVSDALTLDRRMRTELAAYRRRVDLLALALAAALTSAIAGLAYLLGKSIIQPLIQLHEGTEAIGAGNLSYRVGTRARDELGQLSRDFDRMLDRLQEVTASREDLRREIEARTRTETALRQANERLGAQLLEIEALQAKLREQAIRDPLTGLFNRRYLDETLARELSEAQREGYPVTVVMVDIDHFKRVNDTYGHKAGDLVLQALGRQLQGHSRAGDIACRYGGEEFLMVLPHAPTEIARQRAEEWRISFEVLRVPFGDQEIRATLSLGVATYPTHGAAAEPVVAKADEALYLAKGGGRNRVVVAS